MKVDGVKAVPYVLIAINAAVLIGVSIYFCCQFHELNKHLIKKGDEEDHESERVVYRKPQNQKYHNEIVLNKHLKLVA